MDKRVNKLKTQIQSAEKEIQQIQSDCKHQKQKLSLTKTNEVRWVCEDCEAITRFPTPDEIKQFLS